MGDLGYCSQCAGKVHMRGDVPTCGSCGLPREGPFAADPAEITSFDWMPASPGPSRFAGSPPAAHEPTPAPPGLPVPQAGQPQRRRR